MLSNVLLAEHGGWSGSGHVHVPNPLCRACRYLQAIAPLLLNYHPPQSQDVTEVQHGGPSRLVRSSPGRAQEALPSWSENNKKNTYGQLQGHVEADSLKAIHPWRVRRRQHTNTSRCILLACIGIEQSG